MAKGFGGWYDALKPHTEKEYPIRGAWRKPMIRFACPKCSATYSVSDSAAGRKANCKKCGQRLQVPRPDEVTLVEDDSEELELLPEARAISPQPILATIGFGVLLIAAFCPWITDSGTKEGITVFDSAWLALVPLLIVTGVLVVMCWVRERTAALVFMVINIFLFGVLALMLAWVWSSAQAEGERLDAMYHSNFHAHRLHLSFGGAMLAIGEALLGIAMLQDLNRLATRLTTTKRHRT